MRYDKLDLNLLIALDHMLTLKSVSKTADKMKLTQSAMSNALGRLRDYFDDQLLVPVGRSMELTPKAVILQGQVREIVVRITAMMKSDHVFDPIISDREFRIILSDYAMAVLMPHVLAILAENNASVRIRMDALIDTPSTAIERGDADMIVAPLRLASQAHPFEMLYEDDFVCIADASGAFGRGTTLTTETYLQARHIRVVAPGTNFSLDQELLKEISLERTVGVKCHSFLALPHLVVGSDHLATLQGLLAQRLARAAPVIVHPLPFDLARIQVCLQWHAYKCHDPALLWLRQTFHAAAARLKGPVADDICIHCMQPG